MFNVPGWQDATKKHFGAQDPGIYLVRNKEKRQVATVEIDQHGCWTSPIVVDEFKLVERLTPDFQYVRWATS